MGFSRPRSLRHLLGLLTVVLALPMLGLAGAVAVLQVRGERLMLERAAEADARAVLRQADALVAERLAALRRLATRPDAEAALAAPGPAGHLTLLDPAGAPLRDTRADGASLPTPAREAALALRAAGRLVSPMVEDPASGGHAVLLVEPTAAGLLVLAIPAAAFQERLLATGLGRFDDSRFPALADSEGRILARWRDAARFVGQLAPGAMAAGAEDSLRHGTNLAGLRVLVAEARSPLTGLRVGMGVTEAALAAPYWHSALVLGPAALLLMLLAAAASALVARRIGGPVAELGAAASLLGEGAAPPRLATPLAEVNVIAAAMADAAQRRALAEGQRDLLVRELHHRVKNLLATAQSLASLSARSARDPAAFAAQFGERLRALARTHTLLLEEPGGAIALTTLLEEVAAPYRMGLGRIALHGPPVLLPAEAAVPLGMVLHELATNAAKYGALSVPEGRLRLAWSVEPGDPPRLHLEWEETGGPPIAGPPAREGFGSQLLRRALSGLPGHGVEVAWRPRGLVVQLALGLPPEAATTRAATS
jgi:two-component sensor histidine kinase